MSNYLGLDIGTNSVGWALVNEKHEIVKKKNFALWGVRMFDESKDAKERRTFRSQRRRLVRRRFRINLLQNEFDEEINKIDPYFYERLNDSFLTIEDKKYNNKYTLFNDSCTDKMFFNEYPTIYHLRKALLEKNQKFDIRMLYLAIHHIIKYRGNFLYPQEKFNKSYETVIKDFFEELNELLIEYANEFEDDESYFEKIDVELNDSFFKELEETLTSEMTKNDREKKLLTLFRINKKTLVNELIIKLLCKGIVRVNTLSLVKDQKYDEIKISLSDEELEENIDKLKKNITELNAFYDLLISLKRVVDYYYLVSLLGNDVNYLSDAMVNIYEKHKEELKTLKFLILDYDKQNNTKYYSECFRKKSIENNYVNYIGYNSSGGEVDRFKHCKKEDFYKYIKTLLQKIKNENNEEIIEKIFKEIDNDKYLLKQKSSQNSSIPMQLHLMELEEILDNQSQYYPFLNNVIDNLIVKERIVKIFKYKIPYYIGPLNSNATHSWVKRNSNDKVTPFNLKEVVNFDETAINFIERMQNKCTYLKGNDDFCLPKFSMLYQEYMCLEYLNNMIINKSHITQELKEYLLENYFKCTSKPTKKGLIDCINQKEGYTPSNSEIQDVNCSMSSYIKFKEIFNDDFSYDLIEKIIKDITIFEDKKILERRLKVEYKLDDEKIKKIKQLNYKGYGRLSRHFLNGLVSENKQTGEVFGPIICILRNEIINLQQIIFSDKYNFNKAIDQYNKEIMAENKDKMTPEEFIDEYLYISPIMKRSLIQTVKIIDEIEQIIKPEKIDKYFVECTREAEKKDKNGKGAVKLSRYDNLRELYKKCNEFAPEFSKWGIDLKKLSNTLDNFDKNMLQSDKIYLYFTQLGRSMYTLEKIDLDVLISGNNDYDIDHIYPQAIVQDDSLNNRVLTEKNKNNSKSDRFLFEIEGFLSPKANGFYEFLRSKGLITENKYKRLTKKQLYPGELDSFVNRQIVATNQAVKGVIQFLKLYKKINQSSIIYSRASMVSKFRQKFELYKSRTANNFHHAHDAYLNAVLGDVVDTYFTVNHVHNYRDYRELKNKEITINPLKVLSYDRFKYVNNEKEYYWIVKDSIRLIKHNLYERFDIRETTRQHYKHDLFSKVSILPAKKGSIPVKTKNNDPRANTSRYGGITSDSYPKYVIVKLTDKKGKEKYILEAIPSRYIKKDIEYIKEIYKNDSKCIKVEIVRKNIPINVVIKYERRRFVITGRHDNSRYALKNIIDRYFNYTSVKIIKYLDKYDDNKKIGRNMDESADSILIAAAKDENTKEIRITRDDCNYLLDEIIKTYSKTIYSYPNIKNTISSLLEVKRIDKLKSIPLKECIELLYKILKLLKTNENTGELRMSKMLKPGMKFISESITGYYSNVIFEVPK